MDVMQTLCDGFTKVDLQQWMASNPRLGNNPMVRGLAAALQALQSHVRQRPGQDSIDPSTLLASLRQAVIDAIGEAEAEKLGTDWAAW